MNSSDRNPIDCLAEEFARKIRNGENPTVEEYAERFPEHADEIRIVLPSVEMLEQASLKRATEMQTDSLLAGLTHLGDYRIVDELGRGGMGVVFKAEQESLGRYVAVKVLHHGRAMSALQRQRFEREAQAAAALHHTNIVPVFDVGQCENHHYYVMQFIPGIGLDQWIREGRLLEDTGPDEFKSRLSQDAANWDTSNDKSAVDDAYVAEGLLPKRTARLYEGQSIEGDETGVDEQHDHSRQPLAAGDLVSSGACERITTNDHWMVIAEMVRQVADALDYAHRQGTLHRDIKPANLIRDQQGKVWISDFGLAKLTTEDDLTQTGDVVGTLRYMAPEQFQGHADARTDVYALGLVLYELLTLRPAYDEDDGARLFQQVQQQSPLRPREIAPEVPQDLETIVLKAIAREPQHRYQTAQLLAEDLVLCLEDRPIRARRTNWIERLWRWCRRNPALAGSTAATAGLLLVVAIGATWGYFRAVADRAMTLSQQQRAESNLELALEAFERLFDRISINSTPSVVGQIEDEDGARPMLLDVVSSEQAMLLQDLLDFYDRFAEVNRSNPELQSTIAKANWRVGDIERRLQHLQRAEKAYRRALSIYESLAGNSTESSFALERSTLLNQIGLICQSSRRITVARQTHVTALKLLQGLHAAAERGDNVQYEMARTLNFIGECDLWWSREFSSARTSFDSANKLIADLLASTTDRPDYKYTQAQIYRNQWILLTRESWFRRSPRREMQPGAGAAVPAEVLDAKHQAMTIFEELVSRYPTVPEYQYELCSLLLMTPPMDSLTRGQIQSQWVPILERANGIAAQLCADHVGIVSYAVLHVRIQQRLAACACRASLRDRADQLLEQAAVTIQAYAQQFPDHLALVRQMAEANLAWGDFLLITNRAGQARDKLQAASKQVEDYLQRTQDHFVQRLMLQIYDRLALSLERLHEFEQAAIVVEKAASLRRQAPGPPGRPGARGPQRPRRRRPVPARRP